MELELDCRVESRVGRGPPGRDPHRSHQLRPRGPAMGTAGEYNADRIPPAAVSTSAGACQDLQDDGDLQGAAGLDVHEGVEHPSGPSKSAASHQHLAPSSSGYKPMWASPFRCAASNALNTDRRPRMTATIKAVTAVLALSDGEIRIISRTDRGVSRKSMARRAVPGRSGSEVGAELGSPLLELDQLCPQAPDLTVDVLQLCPGPLSADVSVAVPGRATASTSRRINLRPAQNGLRSSRLGLSWVNGTRLAGWPQVKRVLAT